MGLDAHVLCNCHKKIKVPDELRDFVKFDEEWGFRVRRDREAVDKYPSGIMENFRNWRATACPHERGYQADERIGNVWGMTELKKFFKTAKIDLDVIISNIGSEGNPTTPTVAKMMFDKIQEVKRVKELGELFVVLDQDSVEIASYSADSDEDVVFYRHGAAYRFIYKRDKFTILDCANNKTIFSSSEFTQKITKLEEFDKKRVRREVVFTDVDSGTALKFENGFSGKRIKWEDGSWVKDGRIRLDYPTLVKISKRKRTFDDLYSLQALETVCKASIETGNKIWWC